MIYGYARVSTDAQDLTNQIAQLKAAGCATIFREKISGSTVERPQLKKLMEKLPSRSINGSGVMPGATSKAARRVLTSCVIFAPRRSSGMSR